MRIFVFLYSLLLIHACGPSLPEEVATAMQELPENIDYNFHIKPILSDRCYACHGPDEETLEAGLRLDSESSATQKLVSGRVAVRPHRPGQSSLSDRILSDNPEDMMPPPASKLSLTAREKAMLIKWIEQGATFEPHWAFMKPEKADLPTLPDGMESGHPIDHFVYQRLKENGLQPGVPASKERLLRRVYLDLTGLPPDLEAMDAFLENDDPNAYEQIVEDLLTSEACAERLAMEWMDVARYADSHGMHADGWRNMWPWRDWVISAFHENMSYDTFITLQLAGDLLPDAGKDEILATAFHRNHPMTAEGGAIDEEFRLEYVADRTNTTATALMGMTMECAKCHDHKFDPISQKEYYQLSAFFNNQKELGMTGDDGNYGPMLTLESEETRQQLNTLEEQLRDIESQLAVKEQEIKEQKAFIQSLGDIDPDRDMRAYLPLESIRRKTLNNQEKGIVDGRTYCSTNGNPQLVDGVYGKALEFSNEYDELYLEDVGNTDVQDPLAASLWINTRKKKVDKTQVLLGNAGNKNNFWRGWDFYLDDQNHLNLRLIHSLPHNYLHVQSKDSINLLEWTQVGFSYDGAGQAGGGQLYINGRQIDVRVMYNRLNKNIRTITSGAHHEDNRPLRVSKSYRAFTGDNGIFQGMMDEIRIYHREVSPAEMAKLAEIDPQELSPDQQWSHVLIHHPDIQNLKVERAALLRKIISIRDTIPEIMVMEEMAKPRPTFVLNRGQYNAPTEAVEPATPNQILPFPEDLPTNRLGLAQWLFHPDHPLTARATVNRYWQMIFGTGLVKTANDFGNQGALPTHPDLLDWLAVSFQESGWDIKALLKLMVTSKTYQQSSYATPEQRDKDPENIWLARAPSYRWPAEIIRDNVVAASGLLVDKVGGPSVKPYQPEGLWIEKGTFSHKLLRYEQGTGDDLYRRSLYTFVKRTSPHPAMTVFDVPSRDVCTITRESTNTPLQALVLLNDPQFVEAARVLAERIQHEEKDVEDRIQMAFRLVTGRNPIPDELHLLVDTYEEQLDNFQDDILSAKSLLTVGEKAIDPNHTIATTAAYTVVCSNIINHDEAYMKR